MTVGGQLAGGDAVYGLGHQLGGGGGASRGGDFRVLAAFADDRHGLIFGAGAGTEGQQGDAQQGARGSGVKHLRVTLLIGLTA
ncbi:hypothetical protein D3C78_1516730 [compost metagenome]